MLDSSAEHDPNLLVEWANSVALLYIDYGISLSNGSYTILKSKPVTAEHVKRVVRGANVKAYLMEYDRMDPSNRVVDFSGGLADFDTVIGMLERKEEVPMNKESMDYAAQPEDYKVQKSIREMGLEKNAEFISESPWPASCLTSNPPIGDGKKMNLEELYMTVKTAQAKVEDEAVKLADLQVELDKEFGNMVKQAVMHDYSLGDIAKAASTDLTKELVFSLVKVAKDMPTKFWTDEEITNSFSRVSGSTVDPENPLRQKWACVGECTKQLETKGRARNYLKDKKAEIMEKIKVRKGL